MNVKINWVIEITKLAMQRLWKLQKKKSKRKEINEGETGRKARQKWNNQKNKLFRSKSKIRILKKRWMKLKTKTNKKMRKMNKKIMKTMAKRIATRMRKKRKIISKTRNSERNLISLIYSRKRT